MVLCGCEPQPVVVNPDDDAPDTTVIEDESDVIVEPNGAAVPPTSGPSIEVGVDGDEGVDVNVNRDTNPPSQNP
jgi:hypothetical protein